MLWESLGYTFDTLLFWEVYVAGIIYLVFSFGPLLLLTLLHEGTAAVFIFFVQPFFQALGIMTFVSLIAPIALGFAEDAAWHLPWQFVAEAPWEVGKYALILIAISMATAFVPILGRLPSFNVLVVGVVATTMVFELVGVKGISISDFLPSLGVTFGILLLGAAVSYVGMLVGVFVGMVPLAIISSIFKANSEDVVSLLLYPIISVLGFAPLLVYLSWLRITIS